MSITSKVQWRLVKILLNLTRRDMHTKKVKTLQPVPVAAAALHSQHRLHVFGALGRFGGEQCLQNGPTIPGKCKAWLLHCTPDQQ